MYVHILYYYLILQIATRYVCMPTLWLLLSPQFCALHAGKSKVPFGKRVSSAPISQSCIEQANQVCEMYLQLLSTIVQISSDLLVGLCCNEAVLSKMWSFLRESSALQMKPFLSVQSPLRSVLVLFCQIMQYMLGYVKYVLQNFA